MPVLAAWVFFAVLERWDASRNWCLPLLFAMGAALQFHFWWLSQPNLENPDSLGYFRLGHGLENDLRSILYRPKLYPLFLGLFGSLKAATFVQCLLKVSIGLMLLRFSRVLAWKDRTRHLALFLFLTGSLWLQEPLHIMDTVFFTFLFTAFLLSALETANAFTLPKFACLCLTAGLVTLTRQVGDIALAVSGLAVLAMTKRQWLPRYRAVLAAAALGIAIGFSGAVQNGMIHGVYRRTVGLGVNLYTHASYYQLADPHSPEWEYVSRSLPNERETVGNWTAGYSNDVPWPVNALPHNLERALGSGSKAAIIAADAELSSRFFRWARENPREYLGSVLQEGVRLLWKCEEQYPESILGSFTDPPAALVRLERGIIHQPPWLLLALALAAIILDPKRRKLLVLSAAGVCAYLALFPLIHIGFTRYSLPALPCLLVLACHAADTLRFPRAFRGSAPDAAPAR